MTEREIFEWLRHDDERKCVEFCETTPKSAREISKWINKSIGETGQILERLERNKAIEHLAQGWKATELAIKVLNKYFR